MRMHALCICVRYVPLLHTSDINNSIIQNNSVLRSKSFRQQVDDINELVVALDLFIWQCNKISTMKCGGEIGDISRISTIAHSLHLFFKKKLNRFVFYLWKSQGFQIYVEYVAWNMISLTTKTQWKSPVALAYFAINWKPALRSTFFFGSEQQQKIEDASVNSTATIITTESNRTNNAFMKCTPFVSWSSTIAYSAIETIWRIPSPIHTNILRLNS